MGRRRAGRKKVMLTGEQRERLERLWFVCGNHGAQATTENNGFIQGLMERDSDERDRPTWECLAAVEAALDEGQEGER